MPSVAAKIMGIASDNMDISFRELENTIKVDQGLTARILKIANSAQYARQREITQLQSAITLMGFKMLKNLVLLVTASGMFAKMRKTQFYQRHWYHSLLTAFLGKSIAIKCGLRDVAEETFLAGLFHDVGRVILYSSAPEEYAELDRRGRDEVLMPRDLERETLGTDHQEVGGALLERWNFPEVFVDAALEHDSANITSPHKSVIIMVTVANNIADKFTSEAVPEERQRLLASLYPHTCLHATDVAEYSQNLHDMLAGDALFAECLGLFGVRKQEG